LTTIRDRLNKPERFRKAANDRYVAAELTRWKALFDAVDSHSLSPEQRKAVVVDEDRNLLIAAAGSGKTSVLAAKVVWLLQRGDVSPSDLLVLAFSNDASNELKERLSESLGSETAESIRIGTFHSLGLRTIREVEQRRPPLAPTALDDAALYAQLKSIVAGLVRTNRDFAAHLYGWFLSHFAPYRNLHDCEHYGDYWEYLRRHAIKSLNDEWVRSYEACEIANFLRLNGVRYAYRSDYRPEVRTPERWNYKPDFYLPDANVYIDIVELSDGGEAPGFAGNRWEGSPESVAWKRDVHAEHGSVLVEAYTRERVSGALLPNLADNLRRHRVALAPVPAGELLEVVDRHSHLDGLIRLIASFIKHFKGSALSIEKLFARARRAEDPERARVFAFVFKCVFERYTETLDAAGQIDFDDMIGRATDYVKTGQADVAYRYILIDEFQDISQSRARLVQALLGRVPDARLFAVGDDWQAIMRFSGADIAVMKKFEEYFGHTERRYLERSFRCTKAIADVATKFVLKNDDQIKKTVESCGPEKGMGVCIAFPEPENREPGNRAPGDRPVAAREGPDRPPLERAMATIADDAGPRGGSSDVLLLGRYGRTAPGRQELAELKSRYPTLSFKTKTIHGSKGLTADYAIVFGLGAGQLTFPSEIVDDPLLDLVLPEREQFENAEERRLMYVALTRAKRLVFLLADEAPPSPFVVELLGDEHNVGFFGRSPQADPPCLVCVEGRITRRTTDAGGRTYYYCSNGPYCNHRQPACPNRECGKGLPTPREDGSFRCSACGESYRPCPDCDGGWRLTRKSEHGKFLGCANFPACKGTG
ncbi:MAG: UvrD-helicase domain-containing protein, partial [Rhodospirillaceae bacterium]|nr:UvrD-helicase domain-containing protein [Rhodospirillaceae bacterium]